MKKLLLTICIMLLVVGFSGIASAHLTYVTTNGSFEGSGDIGLFTTLYAGDTSINGWTIDSGSVDWIPSTYWAASDGDRSIDLAGNGPGSISQTFGTIAGEKYTVSFDMTGNPDTEWGAPTEQTLRVSVGNFSEDYTYNLDTDDGWLEKSFAFVGTGGDMTLAFASLETGSWGPAIDNVSAAHAPEPATMLLLGTGLIGLAGVGRKKFFAKKS